MFESRPLDRAPANAAQVSRSVPGNASNVLQRTFERADRLGIEVYPEARKLYQRHRELIRAVHTPADVATAREQLLGALVGGSLTADQAAAKVATLDQRANRDNTEIPELIKQSAQHALAEAWRSIKAHGDQVVDDLRPLVDESVSRSVVLAETVPERITTDRAALAAGPEIAAAWAELAALHDRFLLAHSLVDELRNRSALPIDQPGAYPWRFLPAAYRLGRPERITRRQWEGCPAPLRIPTAHALGAAPGIYTAAEVLDRQTVKA